MKEEVKLKDITTMELTSSDEPSPPARRVTSQRSYKTTKGLQKTRRPSINKHNTKSTAAKKTTTGSSTTKTVPATDLTNQVSSLHNEMPDLREAEEDRVQRSDAPEAAEEAREAEDDASQTTCPTDNTLSLIGLALTQTEAAKSLKNLMKGYGNEEIDEEEREGEGEEVLYI